MGIYDIFVNFYNAFLAIFPPPLQWLVTLLVVVGLVAAFINLIRYNWLFLIVLIVLLPFLFPVLQHLFADLYNVFVYLVGILGISAPRA